MCAGTCDYNEVTTCASVLSTSSVTLLNGVMNRYSRQGPLSREQREISLPDSLLCVGTEITIMFTLASTGGQMWSDI